MYIRMYLLGLFLTEVNTVKRWWMQNWILDTFLTNVLGNFELFRRILASKFAKIWHEICIVPTWGDTIPSEWDSVTRFCCFWFFSWISFPPAPEYCIRTFQIFSKSRRDICKSRCTTGINDTSGKFFHQFPYCCWYRWQICRRWQIATDINDTSGKFATSVNNTGCKQWEQLSNCWQLKMNLKKKMYLYVNSTTQRCPKEILKIFLIEDFFHLQQLCQRQRWCTLSCEFLREFLKKFETALMI